MYEYDGITVNKRGAKKYFVKQICFWIFHSSIKNIDIVPIKQK